MDTDALLVSVSDAHGIGACDYGVRSWCHRVGFDYNAGAAPYRDVLKAYSAYPLPEVMATLLAVLRNAKRMQRAA